MGGVGFGGWYCFGNLRPKNVKEYLEWSGLQLIKWEDKKSWDAVLEENKGWLGDVVGSSNDIEKIKQWCRDVLPKENYEQYSKHSSLLCVDNLQTVKGKIIQKVGSLSGLIQNSNSEEATKQYKVSFLFRKHIEGFKELIGYLTPPPEREGETPKENLEEAYGKLKSWCDSSLVAKPADDLVANVELFCSPKKFKTIKELIDLNGEKMLTDSGNESQLKQKYDEIKNLDTFKNDSDVTSKDSDEGLKTWCDQQKEKEFSSDGVFELYPKFRFRCVIVSEKQS
ncbi:hypothetical protein MHF_1051 [Mycoplasma haemofelis Ohio2]|uniref:Uncharacterized protein n=1 Tax=Mycoplasma haemofelis (strain Ohio2) TaxID=859194 RepID=F6FJA3_MYCHI|nr:hypothetical protein MHF_1051 [Mycoplasma haemofelis Ohio2]